MFNCLGALPNDVLALVRGCWKGMNWKVFILFEVDLRGFVGGGEVWVSENRISYLD